MPITADPPSSAAPAPTRPGIDLFAVRGIRVRLDYSWFFVFLLITWSLAAGYLPSVAPEQTTASHWAAGLLGALLFFASILVHELSHALVARRQGIDVRAITLFLFGGVAEMQTEPKDPASETKVAIVGPLTSLAIAGLFFGVAALLPEPGLAHVILRYLAWVNVALAVFNMLPGYPLDGGRVLRALIWWRTGSLRRATKVAADVGKGLAVAIMVLGAVQIFAGALIGGLWLVFIGMFLRGMAAHGYQNLVLRRALDDNIVEQVMRRDPVTVPPALSLRELVDDYVLGHGFRSFPVTDDGAVLGLISIDDLKRVPRERWADERVVDHMKKRAPENTIAPDAPLGDALRRMLAAGTGRLLVLRDGALAGMLSKDGLARFVEIRHALDDR